MKQESQIKAVVWDMGGVILKTENPAPRLRLAEKFGMSRLALEDLVFSSLDVTRRAERGEILEEDHWDKIRQYFHLKPEEMPAFIDEFWGGDRVDAALVAYISSLKGKFKTALLSNAWSGARHSISSRFGFLDLFDVAVFSAEIHLIKPEPDIYLWMLGQLKVEAQQAVFIDDVQTNVDGARTVGMQAIRYLNTSQVLHDLEAWVC